MVKHSKQFTTRLKIVNYLYKYELMTEKLSSQEAYESGEYNDYELKVIDKIASIYNKLIATIKKYLIPSWTWDRLAPLEKAILITGAFEMQIEDLPLVINELVIIARGLIPNDNYQYINSILDKIGNEYANIKNS